MDFGFRMIFMWMELEKIYDGRKLFDSLFRLAWIQKSRFQDCSSFHGGNGFLGELLVLLFKINGHLYSAYRLNQSEALVLKWFCIYVWDDFIHIYSIQFLAFIWIWERNGTKFGSEILRHHHHQSSARNRLLIFISSFFIRIEKKNIVETVLLTKFEREYWNRTIHMLEIELYLMNFASKIKINIFVLENFQEKILIFYLLALAHPIFHYKIVGV